MGNILPRAIDLQSKLPEEPDFNEACNEDEHKKIGRA